MSIFDGAPQGNNQVQQLLQLLGQNPQLAMMLHQNPQLVQQIESDPNMLQQLMGHMQQGNQTQLPAGMNFGGTPMDAINSPQTASANSQVMDRRNFDTSKNPQLNSYMQNQQNIHQVDIKTEMQKYLNNEYGQQYMRDFTAMLPQNPQPEDQSQAVATAGIRG